MKYLLSIAIGPVQDFIAAARRCRDLWFGSHLLSEVSKAAAASLHDQGAALVFPTPIAHSDLEPESPFTVANKLLSVVETDDIQGVVDHARDAAKERLRLVAQLERRRLRGAEIDWDRYYVQLEGILEFYAAWTPYGQHRESHRRVEELSAGRKALRAFPFYEGIAGEPKSSLDGMREHVVARRSNRLFESNLKDNEWLDAIGVVKRFGGEYKSFDSTVDIAALPYVQGCDRKYPEMMQRYRRFLRDKNLPPETYALLYPHESRQIFEDEEVEDPELEAIRQALEHEPRPPYYAYLIGDGDRMGGAIGGIHDLETHRKFSRQLSLFAAKAKETIELASHRGCAIYCGGDDVVALLPLHTALSCARAVNAAFRDTMTSFNVTFSAGLVVAHALEPLSEVREWARNAESAAKKKGGRDALCISVHPRSGGSVTVWDKWDQLPKLVEDIVELYTARKLSYGVAHDLRNLAERTRGWEEIRGAVPGMARAIVSKKERNEDAERLMRDHVRDPARGWAELETFYKTLLVARPFARARKEAGE